QPRAARLPRPHRPSSRPRRPQPGLGARNCPRLRHHLLGRLRAHGDRPSPGASPPTPEQAPACDLGKEQRMTLATQTLYDWLLFLHVLAAMVWVGGGVMLAAVAARVLRDPDPAAVGRFTASLRSLGPLVLAPATVAVLGLGIGLVVDSDAWDFGQLWLQLGLALFAAAFLIGAVWQSRTALAATR